MERFEKHAERALQILNSHGAFLVSGDSTPNVTGINWGSIGTFWGRPVFVLALRKSRYTYDLIDSTHEFTVSFAYKDLSNEFAKCSSITGRNIDKFSEVHLHSQPARSLKTYVVGDCGLYMECKVLYKTGMEAYQLDDRLKDELYQDKDFHSFFFGEIVDLYEDF